MKHPQVTDPPAGLHRTSGNRKPAAAIGASAIGASAIGASAIGASRIGAAAVGALAIGAVAIGALAIGRLVIGRVLAREVRIDHLTIGTLDIERIGKLPRTLRERRRSPRRVGGMIAGGMRLLVFGLGYSARRLPGGCATAPRGSAARRASPAKAAALRGKGHRTLRLRRHVARGRHRRRRSPTQRTSSSRSRRAQPATRCSPTTPPTSPRRSSFAGSATSPPSASTATTVAAGSTRRRRPGRVPAARPSASPPRAPGPISPAARGVPLGIFRIAGIYGPGRNALVNLAEGTAHRIVKPGQVFNRIHRRRHRRDPRQRASSGPRRASSISPTTSRRRLQDVVAFAAELMGVPPPPRSRSPRPSCRPWPAPSTPRTARLEPAHQGGTRRDAALSDLSRALTSMWRDGTWNALPEGP